MTADLSARYQPQLDLVSRIMSDEVTQWPWAGPREAEKVIREQLARPGEPLRPMVALAVADALGGKLDRVCAPAASLEFCHLAMVVLEDVQDSAPVRDGDRAAHARARTSLAINAASSMRSLAYHPVHRAEMLGPGEKLSIHREIDRAATEWALGQSIGIGWHLGWYQSYADFPYDQMIRWKAGSMFGCAAAIGGRVANARMAAIEAARHIGTSFGILNQMISDYLDVTGNDQDERRRNAGGRSRVLSGPVILLLRTLTSAGSDEDARRVGQMFAGGPEAQDRNWLAKIMDAHGVGELVRDKLTEQAKAIDSQINELFAGTDAAGLRMILELMVSSLQKPDPAPEPSATPSE